MSPTKLSALGRTPHLDAEIPPALLTPIPRFALAAFGVALLGSLIGHASLVLVLALTFGLLVASPAFGPERGSSALLVRQSRVAQIGVRMFFVTTFGVAAWLFITLPFGLAIVCLGGIACLSFCISGLVNLVLQSTRIVRAILAKRT
jgi:hypothetical protein